MRTWITGDAVQARLAEPCLVGNCQQRAYPRFVAVEDDSTRRPTFVARIMLLCNAHWVVLAEGLHRKGADMTDGPLMDATCVHGNYWDECDECWRLADVEFTVDTEECQHCDFQCVLGDVAAQVAHMESAHPDIVWVRKIAAGFVYDERLGLWIDTKA